MIYVRSADPGHVRVSIRPGYPGTRITVAALIIGAAKRGAPR